MVSAFGSALPSLSPAPTAPTPIALAPEAAPTPTGGGGGGEGVGVGGGGGGGAASLPARTISLPEPPSDSISCLSFSTAEPLLACASWDGTVRAGSGPTLVRVNPNPSRNPNLNLHPNFLPNQVRAWSVPNGGTPQHVLTYRHSAPVLVYDSNFSPNPNPDY